MCTIACTIAVLRAPGAPSPGTALPVMGANGVLYRAMTERRSCRQEQSSLGLAFRHARFAHSHISHIRCSAAAIPLPLQTEGSITGNSQSNSPAKLATTTNTLSSNDDRSDKPITSSTAAAVAASFPAVPMLPTPPSSGNLQDVVPYLLRLAFQEQHLVWRLAAAMSCMVVAKLAGISLPLAFKGAVDAMTVSGSAAGMALAALTAVLAYGVLDCVRVVAKEAQSPIFAPVSQAVTRRVAYHTFAHVLSLDTKFHIDRRTGRVSRILERGTRSIAVLYRAVIFTFLPTGLELAGVAALLASRFGPLLAAILGVTFAAYVTWTVLMTQRATDVRKEVNHLENQASSKAVDALLNFETVTLFNNQKLEVGLYDKLLQDLRSASLRAETLAAALNAGQGLILAAGMASILAATIASGNATGGDLVMASGLIVQLWAPLQFLGWFYRELRAALVDMDEFFQILRTSSNIRDGDTPLPLTPWRLGPRAGVHMAAAACAGQPSTASTSGAATISDSSTSARAASSALSSSSPADRNMHTRSSGGVPEVEREVASSSSSNHSSSSSSAIRAGGVGGAVSGLSVELVDVSFGYSVERQILRGVSLRVAPGESVAVVGSSGSGKSTILKLVTRLYDVWPHSETLSTSAPEDGNGTGIGGKCLENNRPSENTSGMDFSTSCSSSISNGTSNGNCTGNGNGNGNGNGVTCASDGHLGPHSEAQWRHQDSTACIGSSSSRHGDKRCSGIYINGVDVRQLRLGDLRSAIAVVPQDTALYYDTIRENIRYGRPDASDDDVEAAARMARLHDTVMALPDQYDTVVGERGLKLSGGEKQRVAIARAFLRSPRLLICDEATSALDSGTEVAIMDSLKELARGRSALFVAHRLSTVRNCDHIVVLRSGVVVEEGSHEQLMSKRGEYAAMWELQANQQATTSTPGEDDGGITDSDVEMSDVEDS